MFRRRYYLNFKKKKFSYSFYIHISQLWRLDLNSTFWLVLCLPARLRSNWLHERFSSSIPAFYVVDFIVSCGFLSKIHSLASLYLQIWLLLYIHFFWLSCSPLHIQIFFNQVSCVSFTTLYVSLLLAIQKHANHFFVASFSCHPQLWQHSSSHNFYLAGRFAVGVSIQ